MTNERKFASDLAAEKLFEKEFKVWTNSRSNFEDEIHYHLQTLSSKLHSNIQKVNLMNCS